MFNVYANVHGRHYGLFILSYGKWLIHATLIISRDDYTNSKLCEDHNQWTKGGKKQKVNTQLIITNYFCMCINWISFMNYEFYASVRLIIIPISPFRAINYGQKFELIKISSKNITDYPYVKILSKSESVKFSLIESVICLFTD